MSEYKQMWRSFMDFSGRSTVREYWMAVLVNFIVVLLLGWLAPKAHLSILPFFYSLAVIVPRLSLTVRRLNDTGKKWYYLFIGLIPVVGTIILTVFLCLPSKRDYYTETA